MNQHYAVFCYHLYYPAGGWNDFRGAFSNLEDAVVWASGEDCDRWHIVDLRTFEVERSGFRKY